MKFHIVTIGEPKLQYARDGFNEYIKRISAFHTVTVTHIKDNPQGPQKMLHLMSDAQFSILLDEHGKMFSSATLAEFIDEKAVSGISEIMFLIGGPDGHPADIQKKSHLKWSMSELTFPHDMAMLILVETLYRSSTISAGHPYHRI